LARTPRPVAAACPDAPGRLPAAALAVGPRWALAGQAAGPGQSGSGRCGLGQAGLRDRGATASAKEQGAQADFNQRA
jgi:hypothetical protein